MSCGNHHETPCTEVLDRIYAYLDGELDSSDGAKVRQHLDECGPCLREFGLEDAVKKLIRQRCCDPAPADLRAKVMVRIQEVRTTIIEVSDLPRRLTRCELSTRIVRPCRFRKSPKTQHQLWAYADLPRRVTLGFR